MGKKCWIAIVVLLAATFAVGALGDGSLFRSVWPALVAFAGIVLLKEAAAGLALGVAAAALLVAHGNPASALRTVMMESGPSARRMLTSTLSQRRSLRSAMPARRASSRRPITRRWCSTRTASTARSCRP